MERNHQVAAVLDPRLTLTRSNRYYQPGGLDTQVWFQIVAGDYENLLNAMDWPRLFETQKSPIELMDVGCGTGKFPMLLAERLQPDAPVLYDLLDPSEYSLSTATECLPTPYQTRRGLHTTLEALDLTDCSPNGYDIVWAIQSLYCLSPDRLTECMDKIHSLLNRNQGIAVFAITERQAFFHRVFDLYQSLLHEGLSDPFINAESIANAIDELGLQSAVRRVDCVHRVSAQEDEVLERYLQQCVMDRLPLEVWREQAPMRRLLDSYRCGSHYVFPNPVWLILSLPHGSGRAGQALADFFL